MLPCLDSAVLFSDLGHLKGSSLHCCCSGQHEQHLRALSESLQPWTASIFVQLRCRSKGASLGQQTTPNQDADLKIFLGVNNRRPESDKQHYAEMDLVTHLTDRTLFAVPKSILSASAT